jgi:hypothetical protein
MKIWKYENMEIWKYGNIKINIRININVKNINWFYDYTLTIKAINYILLAIF